MWPTHRPGRTALDKEIAQLGHGTSPFGRAAPFLGPGVPDPGAIFRSAIITGVGRWFPQWLAFWRVSGWQRLSGAKRHFEVQEYLHGYLRWNLF